MNSNGFIYYLDWRLRLAVHSLTHPPPPPVPKPSSVGAEGASIIARAEGLTGTLDPSVAAVDIIEDDSDVESDAAWIAWSLGVMFAWCEGMLIEIQEWMGITQEATCDPYPYPSQQ